MVAVAVVAVEVVGAMVILNMGMVVVTTAMAAEAIDGNCSFGPSPIFSRFPHAGTYDRCALARSADLMPVARHLLILCGLRRWPCPFVCNRLSRI
jgi:hypothetical protein